MTHALCGHEFVTWLQKKESLTTRFIVDTCVMSPWVREGYGGSYFCCDYTSDMAGEH